jgi:ferric enterobactin receptor
VPFLSLDADGNIRLKGNTDFRILINGKPSSLVERSYKEVLRSMPASSIQRIEVITTPPAKYDAEGLAGIINIITNKKLMGATTVRLTSASGFPSVGRAWADRFRLNSVNGHVWFWRGKFLSNSSDHHDNRPNYVRN